MIEKAQVNGRIKKIKKLIKILQYTDLDYQLITMTK